MSDETNTLKRLINAVGRIKPGTPIPFLEGGELIMLLSEARAAISRLEGGEQAGEREIALIDTALSLNPYDASSGIAASLYESSIRNQGADDEDVRQDDTLRRLSELIAQHTKEPTR